MSIILVPSICQSSNCSSLIFKDGTGNYSITNINGYNAPNESIIGATAELIITLANGTVTTLSLTSAGFPTTNTLLEYTINASDIGYSSTSKIDDQIITIQYKVITALTTISLNKVELKV